MFLYFCIFFFVFLYFCIFVFLYFCIFMFLYFFIFIFLYFYVLVFLYSCIVYCLAIFLRVFECFTKAYNIVWKAQCVSAAIWKSFRGFAIIPFAQNAVFEYDLKLSSLSSLFLIWVEIQKKMHHTEHKMRNHHKRRLFLHKRMNSVANLRRLTHIFDKFATYFPETRAGGRGANVIRSFFFWIHLIWTSPNDKCSNKCVLKCKILNTKCCW